MWRGGRSPTHIGEITADFSFLLCVLRYFFFLCICIVFIIRNVKICSLFWKNLESVISIKRMYGCRWTLELESPVSVVFSNFFNVYLLLRDRERQSMSRGRAEGEGDRI